MPKQPMKKPVAKKTVTRVTAKPRTATKVVAKPKASGRASTPKTGDSLKKDVARAKSAVNAKRVAQATNKNRLERRNANNGLVKRKQIQAGLGTAMNRAGNLAGYGINYNKFKLMYDLAGDTVGEGDRESAYWKKSSIDYLTKEAIKTGVAKNKQGAKMAAEYIVKSFARDQANIYSEEAREKKRK
jgi:hypothetical protein